MVLFARGAGKLRARGSRLMKASSAILHQLRGNVCIGRGIISFLTLFRDNALPKYSVFPGLSDAEKGSQWEMHLRIESAGVTEMYYKVLQRR